MITGFVKEAYELQAHQRKALNKLSKTDRLLLYHGLGSGKTLSSIAAAQENEMPLTVIGPAALKANYPKEVHKHKVDIDPSVHTYNKPPKGKHKGLVVFDEAHRMGRLDSARSKYPDTISGDKTMFMTGTPIRNDPTELIPLLRGLGINAGRDPRAFNSAFVKEVKENPGLWASLVHGAQPGVRLEAQHLKDLQRALRGKVDYYKPSHEGYPAVSNEEINVTMTPEQHSAYKMSLKGNPSLAYKISKGISPSKAEMGNLNAFMTGPRQISNSPAGFNMKATAADAPKISRAVQEIMTRSKDPNYRGVTYSNFLAHGISPIAKQLEANGIPHAVFTGEQSDKEKAKIVRDYNSGKIKHLLISGAGAEGLDLKGTKLMQLLEPHWNEAQLEQVVGRGVRFQSHSHLPEAERNVHVQRFYARPPETGIIFKSRAQGADEYLRMLARRKQQLNDQFLRAIQEVGSE